MKKFIIALSFVFLVSPFVTQASIDKNLYYGLKNDAQVVELQEFLIDNSYLSGSATGNFFSLTLKGVKKFQADNGLPTTGFVGTLTRAEINKKLAMGLAESEEELAKEPVVPTIPTFPSVVPTIPTYSIAPSYSNPMPENPILVSPIVQENPDFGNITYTITPSIALYQSNVSVTFNLTNKSGGVWFGRVVVEHESPSVGRIFDGNIEGQLTINYTSTAMFNNLRFYIYNPGNDYLVNPLKKDINIPTLVEGKVYIIGKDGGGRIPESDWNDFLQCTITINFGVCSDRYSK